jgi:hypothetical protein
VALSKVAPLADNVEITRPNGTPTPYFVRQLARLLAEKAVTDALAEAAQPGDADLTAISALSGTGIVVRTAADTWDTRSLTAPAAGISITNPAGVAGNPTFSLNNDLGALEALSGTNTIYYRSATDTWTAVTIGTGLIFSAGTLTATGTGTITATGSPASGNLAKFSSATAITNGNLSGDVTTSGTLATTIGNVNYSATITATGTPPTNAPGYLGCPQNTQNSSYTTVLTDAGKHLYHTSASAHTWTIDSNANVAYPIGTILTFLNESGGGNVTIAITSDTLRWGSSTGSRTLAANGTATAIKVTSTAWRLTGDGIT